MENIENSPLERPEDISLPPAGLPAQAGTSFLAKLKGNWPVALGALGSIVLFAALIYAGYSYGKRGQEVQQSPVLSPSLISVITPVRRLSPTETIIVPTEGDGLEQKRETKYFEYVTYEDEYLKFMYPVGWSIGNVSTGIVKNEKFGDNFEGVRQIQIVGTGLGGPKGFIFDVVLRTDVSSSPELLVDLLNPTDSRYKIIRRYDLENGLTLLGTIEKVCGGRCVDWYTMLVGEVRDEKLYGFYSGTQYFTQFDFIGGKGTLSHKEVTDPAEFVELVLQCDGQEVEVETLDKCYEVVKMFFATVERKR